MHPYSRAMPPYPGPGAMPPPPQPGMYPHHPPNAPGGSYYTPYNHPLKLSTLTSVEAFVQWGIEHAGKTSYEQALREACAMAFLYGKGYPQQTAYQMVESWDVGQKMYPGDRE
ncbi:hypothetical protein A374_07854 [Fictibacillus macauensis ZFHKF-1]|uniref:Uncharacterized protein n=1 Tax=Fictibacillus macauensis ZFHKF-1 TaxID=1196324 RepID=I8AIY3_9BACL|nr:hypothetical protein [Fictibacillus macauensis]EIT85732.1 hypothetical protein A374_07854 [Fictibacillus macauensis ZFHKF-1]